MSDYSKGIFTNAVVLRKVESNIKDSVYAQLLWAIDKLGVNEYWQAKIQPLKLIYKPSGQEIIFRGSNNQEDYRKLKSTKAKKGFFKYIWYEEVDEFYGIHEIRSINQSILRGGAGFIAFYTYNPPKTVNSWVNKEILDTEGKYIHHSTYLDVPKEWLGEQFIEEAESLKRKDKIAYENEYIGEVTGTGGLIFNNITCREILKDEIETFDNIKAGIDWGFATDPAVYTENHFDSKHRKLYIFKEIYKTGMQNRVFIDMIKNIMITERIQITGDSSEPKSIAEAKSNGLRIEGAVKGPDSVDYGIKWLQDLEEIIIDPIRCPNTYKEFSTYEYEKDKNGEFKASYPDKNNHTIDATRYSRENDMKNRRREIITERPYWLY
jgi:PBSX family phage terminase large subunit